jgi:diaminopimelate decarboxylase
MEVKRSRDVEFVLLDSGINHLGGMSGLGRLLRPSAAPHDAQPDDPRLNLVGPLCTPADVLGRNVTAPRPSAGKPVIFPNVGAYGLTAGLLAFLSRPAPLEVATYREEVVSATRVELVRVVV